MSGLALEDVLEATGYLEGGQPAPGVSLNEDARAGRRGREFAPDALWRGPSALSVYFKYAEEKPDDEVVTRWRREIWNEGFAPLLWIVSPSRIDLYNGFGRPLPLGDAEKHRLRSFRAIEQELDELDALAGRLAMETGQFWLHDHKVDRRTSVDQQLLADLATLEDDLLETNLDRSAAQALIGRSIFTQYLIDRRIVDEARLSQHCGERSFPSALRRPAAAQRLFAWLRDVFNGDMFLETAVREQLGEEHLARIAEFLEGTDPSGQLSLFPYQFDVIPVDLISSIYEQFAHSDTRRPSRRDLLSGLRRDVERLGVHYTRLPVVSLVLDEVMEGLTGSETVLDLTCGSGVFLVEALRRLVALRANGAPPERELIRSILYKQIYGVDISEAAVRVAAFSLYLAALELDPDPQPPEALKFEPLIERTLLIGDARDIETKYKAAPLWIGHSLRQFDVIVGNPPWDFKGRRETARRRGGAPDALLQPRGEGQDFVLRALDFAHEATRFGVVLSATQFFSKSITGIKATRNVVRRLSPVTLVNLSALSSWLFTTASMPAIVLLARSRPQRPDQLTLVNVPWSPAGQKTGTFEISPSDVTVVRLQEWERHPERLKAAIYGTSRDVMLLDALSYRCSALGSWFTQVGAALKRGLTYGDRSKDAGALLGLPLLEARNQQRFSVPANLPTFNDTTAERPRDRKSYRAPILLIKELFVDDPRPIAAVAERDLVFTQSFFGASLPKTYRNAAYLIAAILNSAFASWFFLMTSAEFGIFKRRLLMPDVERLPIPDLEAALKTHAGWKLLELKAAFQGREPSDAEWRALDQAVFDLYRLDAEDRVIVEDGLLRASWQWSEGRHRSAAAARLKEDLLDYARAFLDGIGAWLSARNSRHMTAEVFDLAHSMPLRVVRFILEDGPGPSTVTIVRPQGDLADVLARIGERLGVRLASSVVGERELRVHGPNEVVIIKPAARRFWMRVAALDDADAVIAESFRGAAA